MCMRWGLTRHKLLLKNRWSVTDLAPQWQPSRAEASSSGRPDLCRGRPCPGSVTRGGDRTCGQADVWRDNWRKHHVHITVDFHSLWQQIVQGTSIVKSFLRHWHKCTRNAISEKLLIKFCQKNELYTTSDLRWWIKQIGLSIIKELMYYCRNLQFILVISALSKKNQNKTKYQTHWW